MSDGQQTAKLHLVGKLMFLLFFCNQKTWHTQGKLSTANMQPRDHITLQMVVMHVGRFYLQWTF